MRTSRTTYLLGLALALVTVLFLVAAAGALGIVGDGGAADRPFLLVPAVLLVGAAVARLRAHAMAIALLVTAGVQAAVAVGAAIAVATGSGDYAGASVVDVLGINAMFVALFATAALLFRRASTGLAPAQP